MHRVCTVPYSWSGCHQTTRGLLPIPQTVRRRKRSEAGEIRTKRRIVSSRRERTGQNSATLPTTPTERPKGHYPVDFYHYLKIKKARKERYYTTVLQELKSLQSLINAENMRTLALNSTKQCKSKALGQWCQLHSEAEYPHLFKVAYAVPPHFMNRDLTRFSEKIIGAVESKLPESDFRGDKARRRVSRAIRLLNNVFEKEEKPTMFVIEDLLYESIFIWLSKFPREMKDQVHKVFPDICIFRRDQERYFSLPTDAGVERHATNIMVIHEQKGFIFIQVKAIGDYDNASDTQIKQKVNKAIQQLEADEKVLNCIMGENCRAFITKVVSLPNSSRENFDLSYLDNMQGVVFMFLEDLVCDNIEKAESETNLQEFRKWFNMLPDKPISNAVNVKELISRYVGILSKPVHFQEFNERSRTTNTSDYLIWTAYRFKRLIINKQQEDILLDRSMRRVFLNGPPGSGKTMMLFLKAVKFLTEEQGSHVIVVSLCRGTPCRPIGRVLHSSIQDFDSPSFVSRVHHVRVDVNNDDYNFTKDVLERISHSQSRKLMFVMGEIHVPQYWRKILQSYSETFQDSVVWCTGTLISNPDPSVFQEKHLDAALRCPPSIQNVLYHVDWDDTRKLLYSPDTANYETPTNGPVPLSVRHEMHNTSVSVTDCSQCALELLHLLGDKDKLNVTGGLDMSSEADFTSRASRLLPCNIAILVNISECLYQQADTGDNYIETSQEAFRKYMQRIGQSVFVETLKDKMTLNIKVVTDLSDVNFEQEKYWDEILVAWVDSFQGVERDIVIFLPGTNDRSSVNPRWEPCPTVRLESRPSNEYFLENDETLPMENRIVSFHDGKSFLGEMYSQRTLSSQSHISQSRENSKRDKRLLPALGLSTHLAGNFRHRKANDRAPSIPQIKVRNKREIPIGLASLYWHVSDIVIGTRLVYFWQHLAVYHS